MSAGPALSPERQALLEVCARRDGLLELMAKLRSAEEEEDAALWEFYDQERQAEEALSEAKATERRRTIAVILAEPQPAGPNTEQALEQLAAVKRLIGAALGRKTAIREELAKREAESATIRTRVRDAQAAVIASEPEALERLWHHGMRLLAALACDQPAGHAAGRRRAGRFRLGRDMVRASSRQRAFARLAVDVARSTTAAVT